MTSGSATRRTDAHRREVLAHVQAEQDRARRRRTVSIAVTAIAVLAVVAVVAAMMLTSRPTSTSTTRPAPDFTLTDTTGRQVHLSDFRGKPVVLYFSEGAGCGSCLQQMAAIEQHQAAFAAAGVTVLPVVMNTSDQITADMATYGVTTPFLLDDGRVSTAYGTIGRGMHAGLPGHSFVLIDASGIQRWYGEYPSMWLDPIQLLSEVTGHLASA